MDMKTLMTRMLPQRRPLQRPVVPEGLYPYMREVDGQCTRFHLRVEADGSGYLLANATAAARLNPPGVVMAKQLLDGEAPENIVPRLGRWFRGAPPEAVQADLERIERLMTDLLAPGDNYPILNLTDPALTGDVQPLNKPLSADLPLAEPDRIRPLLERLWSWGIPHVTILVPEPPDANGLVQVVERAEDLGMIAGVRARAGDLHQGTLLKDLAMAGVDHVNVYYLSSDAAVHDALLGNGDHALARKALDEVRSNEVCVLAETPLIEQTLQTLEETLDDLIGLGIGTIGFYAIAATDDVPQNDRQGALLPDELLQTAADIEESAHEPRPSPRSPLPQGEGLGARAQELNSVGGRVQREGVRLLWYAPVQRNPAKPLAKQVLAGPRASGDHAIRIQSDGDVYPARGPRQSIGNLLRDDWTMIASHPAYQRYRERVTTDTHCDECPGLAICAADCPRSPLGWAEDVG